MIVIPTEAHPLKWPNNVRRTADRKESAFHRISKGEFRARTHRTPAEALAKIRDELRMMGAENVVISSNLPLRHDGQPYSSPTPAPLGDPGVAVYWSTKIGRRVVPYCIPCDKFARIGCNAFAVGKSIENMRGMDRWGAVTLEQAFAGFAALPPGDGAGAGPEPIDWRSVLGGSWSEENDNEETLAIAKMRHRKLAAAAHPDRGGDVTAMAVLNAAIEAAERELT